MAIFGLWRPENEPEVNLLVGLESSKFTAGNILAGTLNLRGLDLTRMVMDIWRPGSTVFLRSIGNPESFVGPLVHPLICTTMS